jgi:hypothetical protein
MVVAGELEQRARKRYELRDLLLLCGITPPSASVLNAVLTECPDVDLAFTAMTMVPRPAWVHDLAGPMST